MFVEKGEIFPEKFMESQLMRRDHSAKIWNLQQKNLELQSGLQLKGR
jgi:hypothetical protein